MFSFEVTSLNPGMPISTGGAAEEERGAGLTEEPRARALPGTTLLIPHPLDFWTQCVTVPPVSVMCVSALPALMHQLWWQFHKFQKWASSSLPWMSAVPVLSTWHVWYSGCTMLFPVTEFLGRMSLQQILWGKKCFIYEGDITLMSENGAGMSP